MMLLVRRLRPFLGALDGRLKSRPMPVIRLVAVVREWILLIDYPDACSFCRGETRLGQLGRPPRHQASCPGTNPHGKSCSSGGKAGNMWIRV